MDSARSADDRRPAAAEGADEGKADDLPDGPGDGEEQQPSTARSSESGSVYSTGELPMPMQTLTRARSRPTMDMGPVKTSVGATSEPKPLGVVPSPNSAREPRQRGIGDASAATAGRVVDETSKHEPSSTGQAALPTPKKQPVHVDAGKPASNAAARASQQKTVSQETAKTHGAVPLSRVDEPQSNPQERGRDTVVGPPVRATLPVDTKVPATSDEPGGQPEPWGGTSSMDSAGGRGAAQERRGSGTRVNADSSFVAQGSLEAMAEAATRDSGHQVRQHPKPRSKKPDSIGAGTVFLQSEGASNAKHQPRSKPSKDARQGRDDDSFATMMGPLPQALRPRKSGMQVVPLPNTRESSRQPPSSPIVRKGAASSASGSGLIPPGVRSDDSMPPQEGSAVATMRPMTAGESSGDETGSGTGVRPWTSQGDGLRDGGRTGSVLGGRLSGGSRVGSLAPSRMSMTIASVQRRTGSEASQGQNQRRGAASGMRSGAASALTGQGRPPLALRPGSQTNAGLRLAGAEPSGGRFSAGRQVGASALLPLAPKSSRTSGARANANRPSTRGSSSTPPVSPVNAQAKASSRTAGTAWARGPQGVRQSARRSAGASAPVYRHVSTQPAKSEHVAYQSWQKGPPEATPVPTPRQRNAQIAEQRDAVEPTTAPAPNAANITGSQTARMARSSAEPGYGTADDRPQTTPAPRGDQSGYNDEAYGSEASVTGYVDGDYMHGISDGGPESINGKHDAGDGPHRISIKRPAPPTQRRQGLGPRARTVLPASLQSRRGGRGRTSAPKKYRKYTNTARQSSASPGRTDGSDGHQSDASKRERAKSSSPARSRSPHRSDSPVGQAVPATGGGYIQASPISSRNARSRRMEQQQKQSQQDERLQPGMSIQHVHPAPGARPPSHVSASTSRYREMEHPRSKPIAYVGAMGPSASAEQLRADDGLMGRVGALGSRSSTGLLEGPLEPAVRPASRQGSTARRDDTSRGKSYGGRHPTSRVGVGIGAGQPGESRRPLTGPATPASAAAVARSMRQSKIAAGDISETDDHSWQVGMDAAAEQQLRPLSDAEHDLDMYGGGEGARAAPSAMPEPANPSPRGRKAGKRRKRHRRRRSPRGARAKTFDRQVLQGAAVKRDGDGMIERKERDDADAAARRMRFMQNRPRPRVVAPLAGLRDTSQIALETSAALQAEIARIGGGGVLQAQRPDRAGMASVRLDGSGGGSLPYSTSGMPSELLGESMPSPREAVGALQGLRQPREGARQSFRHAGGHLSGADDLLRRSQAAPPRAVPGDRHRQAGNAWGQKQGMPGALQTESLQQPLGAYGGGSREQGPIVAEFRRQRPATPPSGDLGTGDFTSPRAELTLASPAVALRVAREEEAKAEAAMAQLQRMRREQLGAGMGAPTNASHPAGAHQQPSIAAASSTVAATLGGRLGAAPMHHAARQGESQGATRSRPKSADGIGGALLRLARGQRRRLDSPLRNFEVDATQSDGRTSGTLYDAYGPLPVEDQPSSRLRPSSAHAYSSESLHGAEVVGTGMAVQTAQQARPSHVEVARRLALIADATRRAEEQFAGLGGPVPDGGTGQGGQNRQVGAAESSNAWPGRPSALSEEQGSGQGTGEGKDMEGGEDDLAVRASTVRSGSRWGASERHARAARGPLLRKGATGSAASFSRVGGSNSGSSGVERLFVPEADPAKEWANGLVKPSSDATAGPQGSISAVRSGASAADSSRAAAQGRFGRKAGPSGRRSTGQLGAGAHASGGASPRVQVVGGLKRASGVDVPEDSHRQASRPSAGVAGGGSEIQFSGSGEDKARRRDHLDHDPQNMETPEGGTWLDEGIRGHSPRAGTDRAQLRVQARVSGLLGREGPSASHGGVHMLARVSPETVQVSGSPLGGDSGGKMNRGGAAEADLRRQAVLSEGSGLVPPLPVRPGGGPVQQPRGSQQAQHSTSKSTVPAGSPSRRTSPMPRPPQRQYESGAGGGSKRRFVGGTLAPRRRAPARATPASGADLRHTVESADSSPGTRGRSGASQQAPKRSVHTVVMGSGEATGPHGVHGGGAGIVYGDGSGTRAAAGSKVRREVDSSDLRQSSHGSDRLAPFTPRNGGGQSESGVLEGGSDAEFGSYADGERSGQSLQHASPGPGIGRPVRGRTRGMLPDVDSEEALPTAEDRGDEVWTDGVVGIAGT